MTFGMKDVTFPEPACSKQGVWMVRVTASSPPYSHSIEEDAPDVWFRTVGSLQPPSLSSQRLGPLVLYQKSLASRALTLMEDYVCISLQGA